MEIKYPINCFSHSLKAILSQNVISTRRKIETMTMCRHSLPWRWDQTIKKLILNNSIGYKLRSEKIQTSTAINGQTYLNVTLTTEKDHKVQLPLVITFHKLQGKPRPKLMTVLTEWRFLSDIAYNGFLIAISRIKFRSNLRIILITPGNYIVALFEKSNT